MLVLDGLAQKLITAELLHRPYAQLAQRLVAAIWTSSSVLPQDLDAAFAAVSKRNSLELCS